MKVTKKIRNPKALKSPGALETPTVKEKGSRFLRVLKFK
jgi:hypothetical protein